jgi:hypothetical protein
VKELLAWCNPTRWVMLGLVVSAISGAYLWHRNSLIAIGRAECEAAHKAAKDSAIAVQGEQNVEATKEIVVTETLIETKYKDRIKEVIRYVPTPGTVCPADPEFVRLFNDAE